MNDILEYLRCRGYTAFVFKKGKVGEITERVVVYNHDGSKSWIGADPKISIEKDNDGFIAKTEDTEYFFETFSRLEEILEAENVCKS